MEKINSYINETNFFFVKIAMMTSTALPHSMSFFVVSSSLVFNIKLIIDDMNGLSQVADSLLFLLSATHPVDAFGEKCLSCIFAQGLPTPFHAFQVEDHCNQ